MLLTGWEVRIEKNCDRVGGHSFFTILTIRTDPKPDNYIFSFFLAVNWLKTGFVYTTSSLNWIMRRLQTIRIKKSN